MESGRTVVSLDDFEERKLAQTDPAMFLQMHDIPLLIDEVQYAPQLFPYIKMAIDNGAPPSSFWLTGSQAFRMMELAQESLAGRTAIIHMPSLSQHELYGSGDNHKFVIDLESLKERKQTGKPAGLSEIYERIWNGSMPGHRSGKYRDRNVFYSSYVQTYIDRDVSELIANVDKLVFLASSYQDFYVSHTKVKDVKYRTSFVYNPVVYSFKASKEDLINKKKEIIVVGRLLEKHKQVSRILEAWNSIDDVRRDDWKLRIVGDGPDRLFYENIVSSQNIKDVSFEGFQNPLPFYKNASILLMSSAYEGWPMSIIEAMQNGVAVVAMNTFKSASDIIKNGENGILTSSDIHEFSNAIQKLMINTELRRKLALNGMYSCSQYSVEKVVDRWINLFESLYGNEK